MKIIIVGGGIAGTSLYLHLLQHLPVPPAPYPPHELLIYESHNPQPKASSSSSPNASSSSPAPEPSAKPNLTPSTTTIGGGLALAPNGMRVLARLSPSLHTAVLAQGFANERFVFRAARGWRLSSMPCTDVRVPGEACVSMSRMGLWEVLRGFVEASGEGKGVIRYKKVVEVDQGEDGRPAVKFGDGEVEEADLVVGADGVRSVVKKGVFGEGFEPVYMNQAGVGGFVKGRLPDEVKKEKGMIFTFGGNGFFGYGSSAPEEEESLMWWSTYHTPSLPTSNDLSIPTITAELRKRHAAWKDPVIQNIISSVAGSVSSIYPTWTTPSLPHWGRGGLILIGDAAHALQPTSGQGASQCLEDGLALSLTLSHYLSKVYNETNESEQSGSVVDLQAAIDATASVLYAIREPRVRKISEAAKKMDRGKGDIGFFGEMIMCGFMWLFGKVPWIGELRVLSSFLLLLRLRFVTIAG
ncbi:FAD/NAD(P)-binding domain-containing protein [Mytilinidion resinicola]|uniref:FAD/NAD(P)-binding domain-containing protein n=1 Tax=Mytilinidion resinicola TaxID=574789 RepID=A0A6A6XZ78_9PEZI|nr:FAD/NAD(P)-binding domain-containing protein [Mytilinidion resinicola]KAF2801699.1 FAD/NAD(P)-binding domain-containing protein [Mytilinidion resinicola]